MSDSVKAQHSYVTHNKMVRCVQVLKSFCDQDDAKKLAEQHFNIISCVETISTHLLNILKHVDGLIETLYSTSKLYRRLTFFMHLTMTDIEYEFYKQTYSADYYTTLVNLQNMHELVELCTLVSDTWESKFTKMILILKSEKTTCSIIYNKIDVTSKKAKPVLRSYELMQHILQSVEKDQRQIEIADFCNFFYDLYKLDQKI